MVTTNALFSTSQPGGRKPTRREVTATVIAGAPFVRSRDVPDPLGWADYVAEPEATIHVVHNRVAVNRFPLTASPFPLPKPGKAAVRVLTETDPVDEIIGRVLSGRVAPAAAAAVDRSIVFSGEIAGRPPSWALAPYREAHRRRQERGLELLAQPRCEGMLSLDVRNYFPSIPLSLLGPQLVERGAPEGAVIALARAFKVWQSSVSSGLPIGFEGSALLANSYLCPADAALTKTGAAMVRWMDDIWVFLDAPHDPAQVEGALSRALASLGLVLNEGKTVYADGIVADVLIRDAVLDSVTKGDTERLDADQALEVLEWATDNPCDIHWPWVRFGLGAMKHGGSPAALPVLTRLPELFQEEPKAVGDYLTAVAKGPDRKRIPRDWLHDEATRGTEPGHFARRLHACKALAKAKGCNKAMSASLRDVVSEGELPAALRAWSAVAWASNDGWKPSTAVEVAVDGTTDLRIRRAVLDGLRERKSMSSPKADMWRRKLLDIEPDLLPTVAWASRV
jgi:Reverse transcriptase (RNA-dependent DNA polymerase)